MIAIAITYVCYRCNEYQEEWWFGTWKSLRGFRLEISPMNYFSCEECGVRKNANVIGGESVRHL